MTSQQRIQVFTLVDACIDFIDVLVTQGYSDEAAAEILGIPADVVFGIGNFETEVTPAKIEELTARLRGGLQKAVVAPAPRVLEDA